MNNEFGINVFVNSFYITRGSRFVGIDVEIEYNGLEMTIYNFTVVLDDGKVMVSMPENFCSGTLRTFPTFRIYNREKLDYIKSEILDIVNKEKWLIQFLTEGPSD